MLVLYPIELRGPRGSAPQRRPRLTRTRGRFQRAALQATPRRLGGMLYRLWRLGSPPGIHAESEVCLALISNSPQGTDSYSTERLERFQEAARKAVSRDGVVRLLRFDR